MFRFVIENNLISSNQSGFKPRDSCINQPLSINHEIYKSFDNGFEVRGVFLDISKAFHKVWLEGIIFKPKQSHFRQTAQCFISLFKKQEEESYFNWTSFFMDRCKRRCPSGSILGARLFLVYINDLADGLSSNAKLFADDTYLFSVIHNVKTSAN